MMIDRKLYYSIKPIIPRRIQIALRRELARRQYLSNMDTWPIDKRANKRPKNWAGWPEGKRFALILTHDVDTAYGQEKSRLLMNLEERMGFRSSFYFVPERYDVNKNLQRQLVEKGFEVGVHGVNHDGHLYRSRQIFDKRAIKINTYLKEWTAVGFRSPAMHHNLEWIHDLDIEYDASTFDVDPFQIQPDGMSTIFPFWIAENSSQNGYVELPYTLAMDFMLFVLLKKKSIDIWKQKLDWIVEHGGMALLLTHPDYMSFEDGKTGLEEYPVKYYSELLDYIQSEYEGQYWHVLARDISSFWRATYANKA